MIKPWIFEFFHTLSAGDKAAGVTVKAHFDRHIDLWTRDEALGYEGIFFSEHHFGPGYSPAPNMLVAAMASRTTKLRLGTLGASAAHLTALRIVEEAAMLDNLTDGRFEFGIVRGAPPELMELNLTIEQAEARFEATLSAVDAAFHTANTAFTCSGAVVTPPMRQADPPKWLAITGERSARRAGALGWKACSGFISLDALRAHFDAYREAVGKSFNEAAEFLGVRRLVKFVPDRGAVAETKAAVKQATLAILKGGAPSPTPTGKSNVVIDIDAVVGKLLSDDEFVVGTPADVAEQIVHQCRTAGCAHFLANLNSSEDFAEVSQTHATFGEQVIPILRKAKLGSAI